MRRLCDFKPPKPNPLIMWLSKRLLPLYLNLNSLTLEFLFPDQSALHSFKCPSLIILLNHPDKQDPLIAFALAKQLEHPYCIVAREVFDWNHGLSGWLFQHVGCYSVDRGILDIASMRTTKNILAKLQHQLIVFPEAEVTGDDDTVHPFNRGLIHAVLGSQTEIAKNDHSKSVIMLPVGIRYHLETDLETSVSKSLHDIEQKLAILPDKNSDARARAEIAIERVMTILSEHYGFALPEEQPRQEQVRLLTKHICERISRIVNFDSATSSLEQLLHSLRSHVSKQIESAETNRLSPNTHASDAAINNEHLLTDLDRAERLLIFQRVLTHPSTPIQVCRIVDFLEAETCGRMTPKGRQKATICAGPPIEVLPYLTLYKQRKETAILKLQTVIRQEMQAALDRTHERTLPDLESEKTQYTKQATVN